MSGKEQREYKLQFGLVPDSCWYSNLRSILPPGAWDKIRKTAYARAGGKCMICGAPSARLEAHEVWEYDDENGVQKLAGIIAVCPACHEVIHIGLTSLKGREKQACEHFIKVNGCSYAEYRAALGEANRKHRERSAREWKLDISGLIDFM